MARVIELHKSVTESNDRDAQNLREELKEKGLCLDIIDQIDIKFNKAI